MKIIPVALLLLIFSGVYAQIDSKILEGIKIRNVGPAGMSGRITAIDVVNNDPKHIYVGSAS